MCPGMVCGEESIIWMVRHSESPLHVRGSFIEQPRSDFFTCISAGQKTRVKTQVCIRRQQSLLFHLHSMRRIQKVTANLVTAVIWVCTRENMCLCSFVASKLPAFPLNVYHPETCRWKRNPGTAPSTIPV